jgi:Flp pilus assembly protein TadG
MILRPTGVLGRLRRSLAQEQGAVGVLVAICLVFVFLPFAALAINVGSMYQAQRQAQAAADAGALAGADDLGTSTASSATSDGTTYATTNYPGSTANVTCAPPPPSATTPCTNAAASQVTVRVTGTTPTFLGGFLGLPTATVGATAVAGVGPGVPCATPGNTCDAIFSMNTACGTSGSPTYGTTFNGSSDAITGGVHSNSGIDLIGGSQSLGPTTYSNGANCTMKQGGSGDAFTSGPTAEAPITTWPDDYRTVLTACGGTGQVACTGPGGTPSYCTAAQANYTFGNGADALATGNVYCAYGTSTTPSDPATWNGLITFQSGSLGTSSSPILGTFIAGTISIQHQSYLSVQSSTPTYPLFYATGSGTCSSSTVGGVCMSAAGNGLTGPIFSPNGTVQFNGAGSTANFLEGQDVTLVGGSFSGDGPTVPSGGTSGGGVALLQ